MPTKYIRKQGSLRASWKEEDLLQPVGAVKEHRMGVNEAARYFKIPKTTLKRRLRTNCLTKGPCGPPSVLGAINERKMVLHIQKLQACGFSPTRDCVRSMAFKLAEQLNIKHNFDPISQKAGYDWLKSFMERNPQIVVRKSEGVSKNRALGMNREVVKQYFQLLEDALKENNLIKKPGNIYNMDETGLQLNNRPGEVLAIKGSKNFNAITSGEKGETVTVVSCFSGEGSYLPPYCIFKGKNKKAEYGDGMPPGSAIVMNEKSPYINSDIFLDWLKNHFIPRKPPGKVLLILDGHTSHCSSVEMLEYAENNDVILLSLPSHTSHYLQPLDRSFSKSLKSHNYSSCNTFMTNNPSRQITCLQFGKLLSEAWSKSATVENATSGFKRCGIVPLDMEAVPDYCFILQDGEQSNSNQPQTYCLNAFASESGAEAHTQAMSQTSTTSNPQNTESDNAALPGTSTQQDDEKPTPTKTLNKISPIPALYKKKTARSINASIPKVLNSANNIVRLKIADEEKKKKLEIKEGRKRKRETKRALFPQDKKASQKGVVYDDSSSNSQWDENQCVLCLEDYETTKSTADWVKCIKCSRWSHENCTKYGDLCDFCGRMEKKKKRLVVHKIKK